MKRVLLSAITLCMFVLSPAIYADEEGCTCEGREAYGDHHESDDEVAEFFVAPSARLSLGEPFAAASMGEKTLVITASYADTE